MHVFSRVFFTAVVEIVRYYCRLLVRGGENVRYLRADPTLQKWTNWRARRAKLDAIMRTCAPVLRTHAFLRAVRAIFVFFVGGAKVYAFCGVLASFGSTSATLYAYLRAIDTL